MTSYSPICPLSRLPLQRGVAALIAGEQIAVFRTSEDALHAVQNYDPFSEAMVISRGIVGSRGDRPTVASPMYKQVFDLGTGECLDDPTVRLQTYEVRVRGGVVEVAYAPSVRATA